MNKENKQLLKALEINYLTLKHPTMPYITASDWNDNSANALTKCIIHFFNLLRLSS
jgi:valyl-tRNA synthetase